MNKNQLSLRLPVKAFTGLAIFLLTFKFFATTALAAELPVINQGWTLSGQNGAAEKYQAIAPMLLFGESSIRINFNLHGTCLLPDDASAIIFDQPAGVWHYVSLSNYGGNCYNGNQSVIIPLSDFSGLDTTKATGMFHIRFWNNASYQIDINSVTVDGQFAIPTATPTPQATNYPDYKGEYWNDGYGEIPTMPTRAPILTRNDTSVNFDWSSGSPSPSINSDHFVARWTKIQQLDGGTYQFTTTSDDGIRVWIDSQLLIDNWNNHSAETNNATADVTGGTHIIKIEYYENGGLAVAKFNMSKLNLTTNISPMPTAIPAILTSNNIPNNQTWAIQSVSSMKETKDKVCSQDDATFIKNWIAKAKELGANYVAVETPYDNPSCGNSLLYTKAWISAIRSAGLKVWHRHMFLGFEGIYNTAKSKQDYLSKVVDYIKNNPDMFREGDIFTPQPEPQNGGINGLTGCDQNVCMFDSIAGF
ncbi:MAG TPA: PA14 domain-containing protein, partial [Patescibacteria group bacterium]